MKKAKYINYIDTTAQWINKNHSNNIRIYALTKQKNNFDKLIPNLVLGYTSIREYKTFAELCFLQVNPRAQNVNVKSPKYNHVGTSILDSLKELYDKIMLIPDENINVKAFYKKNGFNPFYKDSNYVMWNRSWLKRMKNYLYNLFLNLFK